MYARECFARFGDRVNYWLHIIKLNCSGGGEIIHYDFHYPNVGQFSESGPSRFPLLSCPALWRFRLIMRLDMGEAGIILNLTPSYPRSQHPGGFARSQMGGLSSTNSFSDPSVKGEFPEELVNLLAETDHFTESGKGGSGRIPHEHRGSAGDQLIINPAVLPSEGESNLPHPESPSMPDHFFDPYVCWEAINNPTGVGNRAKRESMICRWI